MAFSIHIDKGPRDEHRVALKGDLDINASPRLKSELALAYEDRPADIFLDLASLDYLDSTGLGALISVLKRARENDHKVVILHAKPSIEKLFYITELDKEFEMGGPDGDC